MAELTLLREANPLADPAEQMRVLRGRGQAPAFEQVLRERSGLPLQAKGIEILQVNVGKVCNQTCRHCHVDAGPDRREAMSREVAEACIRVLDRGGIPKLDITGGAPEMNPHFRWLVSESARLKRRVIDRCNLTILVAPGYEDLPEFLAEHAVEVVASLPCYLEQNVDRQRGNLVFQRSIQAIRRLNELGYGVPGSSLTLTLVFNPTGASLPPPQLKLEDDYRRELRTRYGLEFNHLFTITNMPISRFLDDLIRQDKLEQYMRLLVDAFNPGTIDGLMCRSTLSVDWRGNLFDCDFNQMLEIPVVAEVRKNIVDIAASPDLDLGPMSLRAIVTGQHCFGCTAGAGSSCQGSLAR
jgi:radical SAM/Cys-rich protein